MDRYMAQVLIHKVTDNKGFDESVIHKMILTEHEISLDDVLEEIKMRIELAQGREGE